MCLFTRCVRFLTVLFIFAGFLLNNNFLPASKARFFNASDNHTPLILSLTIPRAVEATAFHSLGNNGNKPQAKRLNSPPTPYPLWIIVPEYIGIQLPLCKHATYWSHIGKYTSVILSSYQTKMVQVFPRCPLCTLRLWKTHVLLEE